MDLTGLSTVEKFAKLMICEGNSRRRNRPFGELKRDSSHMSHSNISRTHDFWSFISQEIGTFWRDCCAFEYLANKGQLAHESRANGELLSFVEKIQTHHCYCCYLCHMWDESSTLQNFFNFKLQFKGSFMVIRRVSDQQRYVSTVVVIATAGTIIERKPLL